VPPVPPVAPATYTISFAAQIGEEAFDCTKSYPNMGVGKTTLKFVDARLWLHDVTLDLADGTNVPVKLSEARPTRTTSDDGAWQKDGVALLDFEDAKGTCEGTPETHTKLVALGTAPTNVTGIRFKVGVPAAKNHLDASASEYPFGIPGMAWQWKSGYRFVRVDATTPVHPKHYFHLGSAACDGEPGQFSCAVPNVPTIALPNFDAAKSTIVLDLAKLYENIDVDKERSFCMSDPGNPICPAMFASFGLAYGTSNAPASQSIFRVR
jgi:uncharacterized repeat protein (TIGR04052 family)